MKGKKESVNINMKMLLKYADSIIATLREPLLVLNKDLKIISANRAFYDTFKVKEKDTIGRLLPDIGDGQWNIPRLLKLLKEIIPQKKVIRDYEVGHKFKQIGERTMCLNALQLRVPKQVAAVITGGAKEEELILLAIGDITERERLQKELKESEERYRRAFETSRDGLLLIHKTEADILNSNESIQELLGYSPEDFLKKKIWEIGVVKDYKDFKEAVSILERDGVIHYDDIPIKTKKGLSIKSEVILVNKAKVIQCNIRDITERKRVEDELAQAKETQYRTLIENLPQKVFLKDKNSVYISCNENYARDLKIRPEEIAGKTDYDIFPTHLAEKYRADDKRIMGSGKTESIEEEYVMIGDYLGNSQTSFVNTVKVPVLDKDGNITGIFGLFWDITDRKKMEAEREEVLKWQKDINALRESLLAPATLDNKLKAVTDSVVRVFNADFCRIWLIRPGDMCEKGCVHADVTDGPHVCRYRDRCLHLAASSGRYTHLDGKDHARVPFGCYKIGRVASGEDHKFLTNDVVHDPRVHNHEWARRLGLVSFAGYQLKIPGGETIGVMALFAKHPITPAEDAVLDGLSTTAAFVVQQAAASDEIVQARAMKSSAEVKSSFIDMVSHELRTPLAAIKEGVSVVLGKIVGGVNEEQRKCLDIAKKNVDRLDRLINAVLDFQTLESGKMKFKIKENDVKEVIEETAQAMLPLAKKNNLDFICQLDEDLPRVNFDHDKIAQVLTNLVNNAIKFTEKGRIVIIAVKGNNFIRIAVKDTGPGIKREDMPKLFQQFTQLQRKTGGTGLGLSICRQIIEAHGGKIWAESEFGKGTTFYFILPIK